MKLIHAIAVVVVAFLIASLIGFIKPIEEISLVINIIFFILGVGFLVGYASWLCFKERIKAAIRFPYRNIRLGG